MVKITITSGSLAGRSRDLQLGDVDPAELFHSMVAHGDQWKTDYSEATEEEQFYFFRGELVAYIIRALTDGRPVIFLDRRWQVVDDNNLATIAGEIEDAIVASGRLITIDSDNEHGLVIGVRGFEM